MEYTTATLRRSFARELATALEGEVRDADEYHSTEQVFEEVADTLRAALEEQAGSPVSVRLRRELADDVAGALENEVRHADEHHSTEQVFEEAAGHLRPE